MDWRVPCPFLPCPGKRTNEERPNPIRSSLSRFFTPCKWQLYEKAMSGTRYFTLRYWQQRLNLGGSGWPGHWRRQRGLALTGKASRLLPSRPPICLKTLLLLMGSIFCILFRLRDSVRFLSWTYSASHACLYVSFSPAACCTTSAKCRSSQSQTTGRKKTLSVTSDACRRL